MSMQIRKLPIIDSLTNIIDNHDYSWLDFSDNYIATASKDSLYENVRKPAGEQKNLPYWFSFTATPCCPASPGTRITAANA